LPLDWFAITPINQLDISKNSFTGPLPPVIPCTLYNFDCSFNELTGPIATVFTGTLACQANYGRSYSGTFNAPDTTIKSFSQHYEFNRLDLSDVSLDFSKPFFISPQDVNECELGTHSCPSNSDCVNGWEPILSYTCQCHSGYAPDTTHPLPDQPCVATYSLGLGVGLGLGLLALLLVLIILILLFLRQSKFSILPDEVSWGYRLYNNRFGLGWTTQGNFRSHFYFKEFSPGTKEFEHIILLWNNYLEGAHGAQMGLEIEKISVVYNPALTSNFMNTFKIQNQRLQSSKRTFFSQTWNKSGNKPEVYDAAQAVIKNCPWNTENSIPIIPAVHGTDAAVSQKICETGFANLSSLDEGYYGKGIYFTTWAAYTISYIATRHQPSLVVSWLLPGNVYPVTEHHGEPGSTLIGTALQSGYNSHFVCTQANGEVSKDHCNNTYNEVVIPQEAQISPAFILHLENKGSEMWASWNRVVKDVKQEY